MRYAVAACQTDFPCPTDRREIDSRVDRMLAMIDGAVVGYRPFFPVRLVVFPEFAHAAPIYATVAELLDRWRGRAANGSGPDQGQGAQA